MNNYHNIPGSQNCNKHLDLPLLAKCTEPELPNAFLCPLSARSALGVPERSPEPVSGADAAIALLPCWQPRQGRLGEDLAVVNVEIYWQRWQLILMLLHPPKSPSPLLSLSAFRSDCPFGLVYCFHPPTHHLPVPHDALPLCSAEFHFFASSSRRYRPPLLLCFPLSIPTPSWFQI